MKTEEKYSREIWLYKALCVTVGVAASLPAARNYIMSGGMVTEWIARIVELADGFHRGEIYFFPQMETLAGTGIWENGVNSNLWFFLPGIFMWITGNIVITYRIYMLLIQMGTLMTSMLFFREIFAKEESRLPVFFGTLLYMTCPYRIFVCYDQANLSQAVAFMLLPLYVQAVLRALAQNKSWRQTVWMGAVLAGIGYADTIFWVSLFGITVLVCIFCRRLRVVEGLVTGGILSLPSLYRLGMYLSGKGLSELDVLVRSIMPGGYRLGQYFSSYFWRDNHPGMGLGMFICLLTVLWMWFVKGERERDVKYRFFVGMALFFTMLSFYRFPWDLVQRLGSWALRLVSLIGRPAVFWGMACFGFCVPAAGGIDKMGRQREKLAAFAVPLIVLLACLWVCIHQCCVLTSNRMPITLE